MLTNADFYTCVS